LATDYLRRLFSITHIAHNFAPALAQPPAQVFFILSKTKENKKKQEKT